jgi:hypothetical protein
MVIEAFVAGAAAPDVCRGSSQKIADRAGQIV